MKRLLNHLKGFISEFLTEVKYFFYDSYSGLRKRRIAIVTGIGIAVIAISIVFIKVVPTGELAKTVADGVVATIDAVLPEDIAKTVKEAIGVVTYGTFKYPEPDENATTPVDTGVSVVIPKGKEIISENTGTEWAWDGSWGAPAQGDIQSTTGDSESEETKETKSSSKGSKKGSKADAGNQSKTSETDAVVDNRYSNWRNQSELYNLTFLTTQSIYDNILLQIHNAIESDNWEVFVLNARSGLMDVAVLGEQIRPNFSESTVAVWNELENIYTELYAEIYMCESEVDLREVAASDTYTKAVDLTTKFLSELNKERADSSE